MHFGSPAVGAPVSDFGTRATNYCWDDADVAVAHHEANSVRRPMSDFQLLAWMVSAGWALPTAGIAIWAHYEPAAWLDFYIFAAFQVWFVARAVTDR